MNFKSDMYLRIWPETTQVALQVTVSHQLHHYQGGLTFGHHTQQAYLRRKQTKTKNTLGHDQQTCSVVLHILHIALYLTAQQMTILLQLSGMFNSNCFLSATCVRLCQYYSINKPSL